MASRTGHFRIPKRKGLIPAPPVPLLDPEEEGSKPNPPDTPIAKAARRLRAENEVLFSPGETEYSKVVCTKVTTLFTKSITKTDSNKMARLEAVTDLAATLKERFDDVMDAEKDHAEHVERIEQENKELEELSQALGVHDIPEKLSFEKKQQFIFAVFKERTIDSERSTKRQTHERVARRSGADKGKDGAGVPMCFKMAPTGGSMRWQ